MFMSHISSILDKIQNRTAHVGVVGLGYVGLPLAMEFAKAGFEVVGIDVSADKVASVNAGKSYIPDVMDADIQALSQADKLSATTDYSAISDLDTISICVPTPLRKTRDPDMSYVISAAEEIGLYLHPGMLIVLESTTYPGTTVEVVLPKMLTNGYTAGNEIFIAFSPERIDPANPAYGVHNTPKVIGGVTSACGDVAVALYDTIVQHVVPVSSPQTAEMVKLLENTFRAVNIGLINETAIMCDKLGVDVWEVIEAAKTKPFGFMPFYPGPGLGGHCIPIDPLYLSWKLKSLNYNARFIELADEINTGMPRHVVSKVTEALNYDSKPIRGSKLLILGVSYKRDVNDIRESPAVDIIDLLQRQGALVSYHDPYVPQIDADSGKISSSGYDKELLSGADCVVIVTDHTCFDWEDVLTHAPLLVDTRNVTAGYSGSARVVKI